MKFQRKCGLVYQKKKMAIFESFILGLLTPLTAVCVLPLYPGFLAYLSNRFSKNVSKKTYALFGVIVALGVIVFMLLLGLIFTTLLQESLTSVIGIVSPIAFGILAFISLLLIFDVDFSRFFPKIKTSTEGNPLKSAFVFGFFFGAIVIPCNPAFIAVFFTRALLFGNFFSSMSNFLAFGGGLAFPLLAFSLISANWSQKIIGFLTKHKKLINRTAGIIMLAIALYYLLCVFPVFGDSALVKAICRPLNAIFGVYTGVF